MTTDAEPPFRELRTEAAGEGRTGMPKVGSA
jgi:hypothetical protein